MGDAPRNALQQEWSADMPFTMCGRGHLSDKNIPPGEDQCDKAGHELVAALVLGGEAAPGPVIFKIGKGVFAVSAVAIELCWA